MRPSFLHSSNRLLHWGQGSTRSIICAQSKIRILKPDGPKISQIHQSSSCGRFGTVRSFSSTSRILAQLGRIDAKRIPVRNLGLKDDILRPNHDPISSALPSGRNPTLYRPLIFFLGFSLLGFGLAVDFTNRDTAQKIDHIRTHQGSFPNWFSRTFSGHANYLDPSDAQLQQLRRLDKLNFIKQYGLNNILPHQLLTWYINLGEGKQICCALALINFQIFALWQLHRFIKPMTNNFTHYPLSGKSYTMITSTFSHSSALHFGFNMLALYSIGSTAHDSLTHRLRASRDTDPIRLPESTPAYHFLAFYIFAGLAAAFGSHAYSLLVRAPRLIKWRQGILKSSTPPSPILPSLGASGAIYGCLTMTALAFPDAHISLIFLPWIPLKIGNAVFGAMLFDFVGVVRNWCYFDHMAHLCGGLAGVFWYFCMDKSFDIVRLKFWDRYYVKENSSK